MSDVLGKSSLLSSCGRQLAICGSRGGADGNRCLAGLCFGRSPQTVESLRFSSGCDFHGTAVVKRRTGGNPRKLPNKQLYPYRYYRPQIRKSLNMMTLSIGKAMKWWEKGLQPNMKEISSAQDLVDSLTNAGNQLVIVDFFSPGCAGCKALHPKICQFAEKNPDIQFLQINYEKHKSMCYSLNVHVLPFFRFYRGAQGRLCSFSCTNATIKKFKDAMAKHGTERCSLGPAKGLEESELLALAGNKDLSFTYTGRSEPELEPVPGLVKEASPPPPPAQNPLSPAPPKTHQRSPSSPHGDEQAGGFSSALYSIRRDYSMAGQLEVVMYLPPPSRPSGGNDPLWSERIRALLCCVFYLVLQAMVFG
ncbi:unnamed protein product [Spirodela intermedia]|uniref:Thioredoxin domain-containing protein n=1 Tax=Spirodela intermedia TaxID=51605 RepID=A0A7I8IBU7_SPIIN|nr:unnamed protein product [Spirodela intermedia]CAA6654522.1 unnamed protein product [Spirodela intermedia]